MLRVFKNKAEVGAVTRAIKGLSDAGFDEWAVLAAGQDDSAPTGAVSFKMRPGVALDCADELIKHAAAQAQTEADRETLAKALLTMANRGLQIAGLPTTEALEAILDRWGSELETLLIKEVRKNDQKSNRP